MISILPYTLAPQLNFMFDSRPCSLYQSSYHLSLQTFFLPRHPASSQLPFCFNLPLPCLPLFFFWLPILSPSFPICFFNLLCLPIQCLFLNQRWTSLQSLVVQANGLHLLWVAQGRSLLSFATTPSGMWYGSAWNPEHEETSTQSSQHV